MPPLTLHTVAAVAHALGNAPQAEIAREHGVSLRSVERIAAGVRSGQLDPAAIRANLPRCASCHRPMAKPIPECGECRAEREAAERTAIIQAVETLPADEISRIVRASISPARRQALENEAQRTVRRERNRRRRAPGRRAYRGHLLDSFQPLDSSP